MGCQKCKNESICKFTNNARSIACSVKEISKIIDNNSPLSVSVNCNKFISNIIPKDCSNSTSYLNQMQMQTQSQQH
jgi:hypothetical protein